MTQPRPMQSSPQKWDLDPADSPRSGHGGTQNSTGLRRLKWREKESVDAKTSAQPELRSAPVDTTMDKPTPEAASAEGNHNDESKRSPTVRTAMTAEDCEGLSEAVATGIRSAVEPMLPPSAQEEQDVQQQQQQQQRPKPPQKHKTGGRRRVAFQTGNHTASIKERALSPL